MIRRIVIVWTLASACAPPAAPAPKQPSAKNAMLPIDLPRGGSEPLQRAIRLTKQGLGEPLSLPEAGIDLDAHLSWVQRTLNPWKLQRHTREREIYDTVSGLPADSQPDRIIGWALLGVLARDTVDSLHRIPVPAEVKNDPQRFSASQKALRQVRAAHLEMAHMAFESCALDGLEVDSSMNALAEFCTEALHSLP